MASIDIKKLFVKVPADQIATFDAQADAFIKGETSIIDANKIYFVADGRIWVAGREYGFDDSVLSDLNATLEDIQAQLGETLEASTSTPENPVYVSVAEQLAKIQGADTVEGSIAYAVANLKKEIMGGDVNELLDTLHEVQEFIAGTDDLADFMTKIGTLKDHVDVFEQHVKDAATATNKLLSNLIGNDPIKAEDGTITYDPAIGENELPVKMTVEVDEEGEVVKTVESSAKTLRSYAEQMAVYNDEQNDRLTTNEAAIVKLREDLTEHTDHNHVFFNENPQADSRNILNLNNHDVIASKGGDGSAYDSVEAKYGETVGEEYRLSANKDKWSNLIMLSKWNVVDIADEKFHTNIATVDKEDVIEGLTVKTTYNNPAHPSVETTTVPSIKINDSYTVATRNELAAVYDAVKGAADGLEERVAENEAELAGLGKHVAEDETAKYNTVLDAIAGEIAKLDLEKDAKGSVAEDAKKYVKTTISEEDGIVKNEAVDVTYGEFGAIATKTVTKQNDKGEDIEVDVKTLPAEAKTEGIATVEDTQKYVKEAIGTLDSEVYSLANGTYQFVKATVKETAGKLTSVQIETKNIAKDTDLKIHKGQCAVDHFITNSAIGTADKGVYEADGVTPKYELAQTKSFTSNEETGEVAYGEPEDLNKLSVWGGIHKTADDAAANLKAAVEALDVEDNVSEEVYGVTVEVNEEDGKVAQPVVAVTPAVYTANVNGAGSLDENKLVDSKALADVLSDLWETFSAE